MESRTRRSDSPLGCSITTHAVTHSSHASLQGQAEGLTRDDILDNVTLYWLTNTAVSSARLYWESKLAFFAPKGVATTGGGERVPDEIYTAPQSWTERAYPKLIHYNRLSQGRAFRSVGTSQVFSEELAQVSVAAISLVVIAKEMSMNRMVYWAVGIVAAAAAVVMSTSAMSAQDKYSLKVPGGIAFSRSKDTKAGKPSRSARTEGSSP